METTVVGKRPRAGRSVGAAVDDAALLRAVEALDPQCGSVDVAARRWQQVAERVVADTGDDVSSEQCKKRYDELISAANHGDLELNDDAKEALERHTQWLRAKRSTGGAEAEAAASTGPGQETQTGGDAGGVSRPRKPRKPSAESLVVVKMEPGLSMVSPPASGKKRKTSVSPAAVVAREKRNSLLARVTATLDRHEKRQSAQSDADESLAARVARNPQEVRVLPPVAKASPVAKGSPEVSPAKSRKEKRLNKPNDLFFSPSKGRGKQEDTKVASVGSDLVAASSKAASGAEGEGGGSQTDDAPVVTPRKVVRAESKTPVRRRSGAKKVAQALLNAMVAVETTPPQARGTEGESASSEDHEMKTEEESKPEAPAESASTPAPADEQPRAIEAAASSETEPVAQEEDTQPGDESTPTTHVPSQEEPMDIDTPSIENVESDGEAEEAQPSASPSIEFDAVDEEPDAGENPKTTEYTRAELKEQFASREEMMELKQEVASLASSLTASRTEQAALKRDLAVTQQCLKVCEGICLVLEQQVSTLTFSLSETQVRNAKLHEEVILLREEIQHGRAEFQQKLAELPSKGQSEGMDSTVASSSSPSELQDIRESLRVHMETIMAAQETRKAAVAAGFGVIDSQLQQLQAAVDRGEQKREELSTTIESLRVSIESQLNAQLKNWQTLLEKEQRNREEVLATVEREREELERERRKQYQQYQAIVDEEKRKREELLASFNEKSNRELERLRDAADINLRVRNELLFKVKAEHEQTKTQNVDRVQAVEEKMATLNGSLIGVEVGLREHREHARATRLDQQQALEALKHQVEQLQAALDKKPYEDIKIGAEGTRDVYGLNRKIEALSTSLAQIQDSLSKQKQANKLRAMEQDSQTKIEWSELRRTLETERSERMRDFSKLLTIVRQSQAGAGNESE